MLAKLTETLHPSKPIAVYVHTPFCPSKCGYCDFNSYAMDGEIVDRTVAAVRRQILQSPWRGRPAKTVFFGGGTPTLLSANQLSCILDALRSSHPFTGDVEITSEANPGTVSLEKLTAMRQAGFNRLSLGAQSFHAGDLRLLGRVHNEFDIFSAFVAARQAGFDNVNLDLMFALPGQTLTAYRRNLNIALSLDPDHLSLYGLTIEANTRFYKYEQRGILHLPSEDSQVQMYEASVESCLKHGLRQYEISNFAKPGYECRHNLAYWHGEEYLGYGPGAVGCVETEKGVHYRYTNLKHPLGYCEAIEQGSKVFCEEETLDEQTLQTERIMLGLRLNEGIPRWWVPISGFEFAMNQGWLTQSGERIMLTRQGRHFCSEVTARLI